MGDELMKAIKAVWVHGQIVPAEPVNWPEGSQLLVEPVAAVSREKLGVTEDDWGDDPDSIAAWVAAVEKLEPMVWSEVEAEEYASFREQFRRFNMEAVRKQMADMPDQGAP